MMTICIEQEANAKDAVDAESKRQIEEAKQQASADLAKEEAQHLQEKEAMSKEIHVFWGFLSMQKLKFMFFEVF